MWDRLPACRVLWGIRQAGSLSHAKNHSLEASARAGAPKHEESERCNAFTLAHASGYFCGFATLLFRDQAQRFQLGKAFVPFTTAVEFEPGRILYGEEVVL